MANGIYNPIPVGGSSATPPPSVRSNGRISVQGQSSSRNQQSRTVAGWRQYADNSGQVTSPPNYPDTSYGAYLSAGGNVLGIGYIAWRDKQLADYQTAYNMYQQWYDSTPQQVSRINAAGLNTNLAYGMASPGFAAGGPAGMSQAPTVGDIFGQVAGVFTGFSGGLKTLAEAADIVNRLPESRFKGIMARQLNAAAAAGAINSENLWKQSLNSARVDIGVGKSQASREQADNILQSAKDSADQQLLEYMTSHDLEGSETDFEGSAFVAGKVIPVKNDALAYAKNKFEFDKLFSDPRYFDTMLKKMVNDNWISYGQAYTVRTIVNDPNLDPQSKALMLQGGLPGFLAKLSGMIASNSIELGKGIGKGVKWFANDVKTGAKKAGESFKNGYKKFKSWNPPINYDPENFTD